MQMKADESGRQLMKVDENICGATYGSVSAGRGKCPTNVTCLKNWSFCVTKPKYFDGLFRFVLTKYDM